LGFGWAKFGGLAFFALVAKLVNKCSYGFDLAKFCGLAFFALVAKLVNK